MPNIRDKRDNSGNGNSGNGAPSAAEPTGTAATGSAATGSAAPDAAPIDAGLIEAGGRAAAHPWIHPVRAFDDNYIWVLAAPDSPRVIVVDPGDARPVIDWMQARDTADAPSTLAAILLTHHHADHTGGVDELKARWPQAPVYGPANGRFGRIDLGVREGQPVSLPPLQADAAPLNAAIIATPGHTLDHIAWVLDAFGPDPRPALFCGDTLFAAGCGRLFEGTPAQMFHSLARLSTLPPQTLVYCAHEYTLSNLAFALSVEPGNVSLQRRARAAQHLRAQGRETVPSTIAIERETNPFLRCGEPAVVRHVATHAGRPVKGARVDGAGVDGTGVDNGRFNRDRVAVFAALRRDKDAFRGTLSSAP